MSTKAQAQLQFREPLSQRQFDELVEAICGEGARFWGNPIALGPHKVHIYGVDKQVWRPVSIEITDSFIVVIGPPDSIRGLAEIVRRVSQVDILWATG